MKAIALTLFLASASLLGPYLDDLDATRATEATVIDRAAESAQLQADLKFAEVSRP